MPLPEPIIHPRSIRLAAVLLIVAVLLKTRPWEAKPEVTPAAPEALEHSGMPAVPNRPDKSRFPDE
jgi:hypothetical protein